MIRIGTMAFFVLCCFSAMTFGAAGTGLPGGAKDPIPAPVDTSAPDAWGYTWVRSTDPGGPTFRWIDITTIGTRVAGLGDDNSVGPFPMLFNFHYYWYDMNTFRIGSNGYMVFGNQTANFASPFAALPNTTAPNDMLAVLAGDLDFTADTATARCYYWSNGVDSLVISWINVTEWQATPNPNLKHTFQLILNKQDSSFTYQYGVQQGQYNATNNNTLCIGIENQTGQIGLSYTFSSTPPHALMPAESLAIRFKRTVNTGLQVTDAGIVGGYNSENLAKIVQQGQPDTVKAIVKNFGTANLSNVRVTYAISRSGQPTLRDTVFVTALLPAEETTVVFPRLFTPAVSGSYSAAFTTFVSGDVGPGNNNKTTEVLSSNFSLTTNTRLAFEGGVSGGSINWSGGTGGMAVDFEVPVAQVRIESVFVTIATVNPSPPPPGLTVEILEGSGGLPGTILGTRTITAVVGTNGISFVSDSIRITSRRFFVGARGNYAFSYETALPISFRTWEYTAGYAPYRSRDVQDVMIRAAVRLESPSGVTPGIDLPERFQLTQNYPNPFNPSTQLVYSLPKEAVVRLVVFDLLGREIRALVNSETKAAGRYVVEWDGKDNRGMGMSSGTYFVRLQAGTYSDTKKVLLMK